MIDSQRMGVIFLSYRRVDAEGQAGRLYGDLVAEFGRDAVFMDVAAIHPGRDFRKEINQTLTSCGVFLTMIGKSWLTAKDESGQNRMDEPTDYVRIETAAALKRDIPVIPVLVQAATVPKADQLPDDLKDLAFRNAIELTHSRWDSDVRVLINALRPYVSIPVPKHESKVMQRISFRNFKLIAIAALVVIGAVLLTFYLRTPKKAGAGANETVAAGSEVAASGSTDTGPTPANRMVDTNQPPEAKSGLTNTAPRRIRSHSLGEGMNIPGKLALPEANAAPTLDQFSLAAHERPLPNNPNRHKFGVWLKVPRALVGEVARVHYDFLDDPNPRSIDGVLDPPFGATYEGRSCYEAVEVTVYFKPARSRPIKKTFDMCKALLQ